MVAEASPGSPGCGLDDRHPAPTERNGPIAKYGAQCAVLGLGQRCLAFGDPTVELAQQNLAHLSIAQSRQHLAYGLPGERLWQRWRLDGVDRVFARAVPRLESLSGHRLQSKQECGEK